MKAKSLYDQLQLDPLASPEEIKRAYYQKAKRSHPDRAVQSQAPQNRLRSDSFGEPLSHAPGEDTDFLAYRDAYEILKDPKQRARYARTLGLRKQFGLSKLEVDGQALNRLSSSKGRSVQYAGVAARNHSLVLRYILEFIDGVISIVSTAVLLLRRLLRSIGRVFERAVPQPRPQTWSFPLHNLQSIPIFPGEVVNIRPPQASTTTSELMQAIAPVVAAQHRLRRIALVELTFPSSNRRPLLLIALDGVTLSQHCILPVSACPPSRTDLLFLTIGTDPFSEAILERGVECFPG